MANVPPLSQRALTVSIPDISTDATAYVVSPFRGKISKVYTVIHGAVTVADATIAVKIGTTAVTGGSITIDYATSAAGVVDSCTPTGANFVEVGDVIALDGDGGSTDACVATATIVIDDF